MEKTFINSVTVKTTKFEAVNSAESLKSAIKNLGYPAVLKSNTMGYDGKGQIMIKVITDDLYFVILILGFEFEFRRCLE
jgi:5-(carboxyamino)imidazole ribonucleotide synthase